MTFSPGALLGPYEILGLLGAGGMGEVWRARDPRLGRDVAIKILPASYATDSDRLKRFEQEARAAGVLNHPNITAVYDIGRHDGTPFVVQELLEGETLRSALAGGKFPQRKAIDTALQIAHGLAAAHEKGITHRDLKPENLFLTKDGRVKILDFGLAKLTRDDGASGPQSNLPTESVGTEPGVVMGTLSYMSPEQVKGQRADARSDIFSLGAILYEMLSGRRAFQGDSAAETISAILREDPPELSATNRSVSPVLERVVRYCIEKNPEQRFHSAHDLALALDQLAGSSTSASGALRGIPATRLWRTATLLLALAAAGAALAAVLLVRRAKAPARDWAASGPRLVRLTWNMRSSRPAVSPDGSSFAYVSTVSDAWDEKSDIFVRRIGGENPVNLTKGSGANNQLPAYSPDGQSIAFWSDRDGGGIFLMGSTGESVRRLTSFGYFPSWSPDGRAIAFSSLASEGWAGDAVSELWVVDVASGKQRKVFDGDAVRPFWSPSGARIAFDGRRQGMAGGRALFTISASGGDPVEVASTPGIGWMTGVWTEGWIWYTNPERGPPSIWRVRVDEATGLVRGSPEPVLRSTTEVGASLSATRSASKILFFAFLREQSLVRWDVDPAKGRVAPEPRTILGGGRPIYGGVPSPDGQWLASLLIDQSNGFLEDILLVREANGEIRRLTDDRLRESVMDWAPDGSRLFFCVSVDGKSELWSIRPDGSGRERVLDSAPVGEILNVAVSPDGKSLYLEAGKGHRPYFLEVGATGVRGNPAPLPPMPGANTFAWGAWSPDGRWMAGVPRKPDGSFDPALVLFDLKSGVYQTFPGARFFRGAPVSDLTGGFFWMPDSRHILLVSEIGEVAVFDRDTGDVKGGGRIAPGFFNLHLSRDGRRLYGNKAGKSMADVWMLDFGTGP